MRDSNRHAALSGRRRVDRLPSLLRLVLGSLAFALPLMIPVESAQAQWGFGYGMGMMGGGGVSNYMNQSNINSRSSAAAGYAYSMRQHMPGTANISSNPNSYTNNIRDTSFYQRFDPSTRRNIESEVSRRPEAGLTAIGVPNTSKPANAKANIPPLTNFFSAAGILVWPSDPPVDGNLGDKKDQAEASLKSVLTQYKAQGFAPVGMVTDARTKLVDYGTPALDYLSQHTTPAVVDTFHRFLLSLYDSLGAAGTSSGVTR